MNSLIIVPAKNIILGYIFLYLILPIYFTPGIRFIMGFESINELNFLFGVSMSLLVFLIFLFLPNYFLIKSFEIRCPKIISNIFIFYIIIQFMLYVQLLFNQEVFYYFDKIVAHEDYEALDKSSHLRLIYNIGLVFFVLDYAKYGFKLRQLFFLLPPTIFEIFFSRHNYITHFLVYIYILFFNKFKSKLINIGMPFIVITFLLALRYWLYSGGNENLYLNASALFGEFSLSWQTIPLSIKYSLESFSPEIQWYSDYFTLKEGLNFGLSGNPISEIIFHTGYFSPFFIFFASVLVVYCFKLSRYNSVFALGSFLTLLYFRDITRTGFFMFFSIYLKSIIIYFIILNFGKIQVSTNMLGFRKILLH